MYSICSSIEGKPNLMIYGLLSNFEESTQMSPFSISFCKTSFVSSFEHDVTELNGRPLNSVD